MNTIRLFVLILTVALLFGCERASEAPAPASTVAVPVAAPPTPEDATAARLDQAIAGAHRSVENRARDLWRHPKETLLFFGLRADMTVVEIYPGGGWYTEILAPVLRDTGKLVAAHFDPNIPPAYRERSYTDYVNTLAGMPTLYDQVEILELGAPEQFNLGDDGSADLVVTFRNIHGLFNDGHLDAMMAASFRVLKSGGVLGVVQHRADEGVDVAASARRGYVPESFVIERAEAAGFRLDGRSEINANPADTKDYDIGVWALPPSLRGELDMRPARVAIGESDRMTLRFTKP